MNSLDSNGAEVYAMLIGCHKLHKLGGYKAIIEADSFLDIQWRCGKSSYPWRLVDLVMEVQDIASYLGVSFSHIPCKVNDMWQMALQQKEFFSLIFLSMFSFLVWFEFCSSKCFFFFLPSFFK